MRDAAVAGVQSRLAASVSERQNPPMKGEVDSPRQPWWLLLLTLFTFFVLLGSRSLNEPDEGRYAEIAREMIELGDWLVPHFWYVPHLDKPPLTYWFVALSLSVFGQNEWAVRLPLALPGRRGSGIGVAPQQPKTFFRVASGRVDRGGTRLFNQRPDCVPRSAGLRGGAVGLPPGRRSADENSVGRVAGGSGAPGDSHPAVVLCGFSPRATFV